MLADCWRYVGGLLAVDIGMKALRGFDVGNVSIYI
jgi:hypothetical protein